MKYIHTIEYKTYLIHVHADGMCFTYFGDFKSELAAKQGVTKYANLNSIEKVKTS